MQLVDSEGRPELARTLPGSYPAKRGGGRRYIDAFFRHWVIALIPVLVLPVAGVGLALKNRGNTMATSNVWVNQVSTKQLGYADPLATPASNTAAALTQLLQTESFDVLVAHGSPLYWNSVALKPNRNASVVTDLSKNVVIVPKGPDLVNISYSSKEPSTGIELLAAILKQAPRQFAELNQHQAASTVAYYTQRRKDAQTRLAHATKALGSYMKKHHLHAAEMAAQSLYDPAFATLYQAVQSTQVDIDNADQQISQATSQSAGNTFLVYDPPSVVQASLSKKSLALDLAIGLAVGLLLSGAFIVGTTALDHSLRYAHEVPDLLGVPILASVGYGKELAREQRSPVSASGGDASDGKRAG
jgi:hypothetical protein